MSQLLTRRGFTQLILAAGAGLALPSAGAAQRALRWTGRLQAAPDPTRLLVDLYVRHSADRTIELPGAAIYLEGELTTAAGDYQLRLHAQRESRRPMSRAAHARPDERPVFVAPEQEQRYARFVGSWPTELAPGREGAPRGEGTLTVRAVLHEVAELAGAERTALARLARFEGTTQVILPA
jgi:hypothetical protein